MYSQVCSSNELYSDLSQLDHLHLLLTIWFSSGSGTGFEDSGVRFEGGVCTEGGMRFEGGVYVLVTTGDTSWAVRVLLSLVAGGSVGRGCREGVVLQQTKE